MDPTSNVSQETVKFVQTTEESVQIDLPPNLQQANQIELGLRQLGQRAQLGNCLCLLSLKADTHFTVPQGIDG